MSDGRSSFSHSIPFLYWDKVSGYIDFSLQQENFSRKIRHVIPVKD